MGVRIAMQDIVRRCLEALKFETSTKRHKDVQLAHEVTRPPEVDLSRPVRPSVVSRNPVLTEQQALRRAERIVSNWEEAGASKEDLARFICENLVDVSAKTSVLTGVTMSNELAWAAYQVSDPNSLEVLHVNAVSLGYLVAELHEALSEVDNFLLSAAATINEQVTEVGSADTEFLSNFSESLMSYEMGLKRYLDEHE